MATITQTGARSFRVAGVTEFVVVMRGAFSAKG
jgi:hypothetical protein